MTKTTTDKSKFIDGGKMKIELLKYPINDGKLVAENSKFIEFMAHKWTSTKQVEAFINVKEILMNEAEFHIFSTTPVDIDLNKHMNQKQWQLAKEEMRSFIADVEELYSPLCEAGILNCGNDERLIKLMSKKMSICPARELKANYKFVYETWKDIIDPFDFEYPCDFIIDTLDRFQKGVFSNQTNYMNDPVKEKAIKNGATSFQVETIRWLSSIRDAIDVDCVIALYENNTLTANLSFIHDIYYYLAWANLPFLETPNPDLYPSESYGVFGCGYNKKDANLCKEMVIALIETIDEYIIDFKTRYGIISEDINL